LRLSNATWYAWGFRTVLTLAKRTKTQDDRSSGTDFDQQRRFRRTQRRFEKILGREPENLRDTIPKVFNVSCTLDRYGTVQEASLQYARFCGIRADRVRLCLSFERRMTDEHVLPK
jgi:hypothetical protein